MRRETVLRQSENIVPNIPRPLTLRLEHAPTPTWCHSALRNFQSGGKCKQESDPQMRGLSETQRSPSYPWKIQLLLQWEPTRQSSFLRIQNRLRERVSYSGASFFATYFAKATKVEKATKDYILKKKPAFAGSGGM